MSNKGTYQKEISSKFKKFIGFGMHKNTKVDISKAIEKAWLGKVEKQNKKFAGKNLENKNT